VPAARTPSSATRTLSGISGQDVRTGQLTFIGTATVLLRCGGFTILTDPNFLHKGDYAKLGYGLRSKRLTEPALSIPELPPLDFVVLSHHHGDHFDEVATASLDKDLPIVTTPHAAKKLAASGFNSPVPLHTWDSQLFVRGESSVRVTAVPGKHAPQPLQTFLPPVMGTLLEFAPKGQIAYRVYVTGDTLFHDRLAEIPRRYPEIDLAAIHLGGTRIAGILLTMNAAQGVRTLDLIRPRIAVPIHFGDYGVFKEPLSVFKDAVEQAILPIQVRYLDRGETLELSLNEA
jgi:L-ascorbate metabolism protein UlaG (beta-lactamase superfamily)